MRRPGRAVIKVGGSVLRDAAAYDAVANRLADELRAGPAWAVASAAGGMTDLVVDALRAGSIDAAVDELARRHRILLRGPLPPELIRDLAAARNEARRGAPERLLTWGERASAEVLRSRLRRLGPELRIRELAWSSRPGPEDSALVPGFYLRAPAGRLRLLPRGGGDISAVLLAAGLGAPVVRLWKRGGGIWLGGRPVDAIDGARLLPHLTDPARPIHVDAVRLSDRLGFELRLEDPFGAGHTTVIRASADAPSGNARAWSPRDLLATAPVVRASEGRATA